MLNSLNIPSSSLLLKIKQVPPMAVDLYQSSVDEAFECAVHQYTSRFNTKKMWEAYIDFKMSQLANQPAISTKLCNELIDLLLRSMLAIPAATNVKENKSVIWKDYSFQNKVLFVLVFSTSYLLSTFSDVRQKTCTSQAILK